MKRALKIAMLAIVLLVVAAAIPIAGTFLGRRSAEETQINGIHIVKDGIVTVAIIPTSEKAVALVDAGNDKAGGAILAELSRMNLDPNAVEAILITHGHPDHTGAVSVFPKAQVMALEREIALIEGREGARGPVTRLFPVKPTGIKVSRALHDGETVTLGETPVEVFGVPGHTAGSAAYLAKGVLFLGDAADIGRDGDMIGSPWIFSDSQSEDRASLTALSKRLSGESGRVQAIAFAHSGVLTQSVRPLEAFALNNQ
jgi:glyoxylase-like metal-dependent hydrolase (beta-lactamase superfamily II)